MSDRISGRSLLCLFFIVCHLSFYPCCLWSGTYILRRVFLLRVKCNYSNKMKTKTARVTPTLVHKLREIHSVFSAMEPAKYYLSIYCIHPRSRQEIEDLQQVLALVLDLPTVLRAAFGEPQISGRFIL